MVRYLVGSVKRFKIDICFFSSTHTALHCKIKHRLVLNRYNISWGATYGLLCQGNRTIKESRAQFVGGKRRPCTVCWSNVENERVVLISFYYMPIPNAFVLTSYDYGV